MTAARIPPSPPGGGPGWGHDGLRASAAPERRPAPIPTFPQKGKAQDHAR
jgi:hypothetical protein